MAFGLRSTQARSEDHHIARNCGEARLQGAYTAQPGSMAFSPEDFVGDRHHAARQQGDVRLGVQLAARSADVENLCRFWASRTAVDFRHRSGVA